MDGMDALDSFAHFLRRAELVVDRDPADDENVSFQLDLPYSFRCEPFV